MCFVLPSKGLVLSHRPPAKNAVTLTQPGFPELSVNLAYLFSSHGDCSLKKPTVLLWSFEVSIGRRRRRRAESDTSRRAGREKALWWCHVGPFSTRADWPVHLKNPQRQLPGPAPSPVSLGSSSICAASVYGALSQTLSWGHWVPALQRLTNGEARGHKHKRKYYTISIILKCEVC